MHVIIIKTIFLRVHMHWANYIVNIDDLYIQHTHTLYYKSLWYIIITYIFYATIILLMYTYLLDMYKFISTYLFFNYYCYWCNILLLYYMKYLYLGNLYLLLSFVFWSLCDFFCFSCVIILYTLYCYLKINNETIQSLFTCTLRIIISITIQTLKHYIYIILY